MKKKSLNSLFDVLLKTLEKESDRLNKISKRRKLNKEESVDLVRYVKLSIDVEKKRNNADSAHTDRELARLSDDELNALYDKVKDT